MEATQEFRKLIYRLSPLTIPNENCVNFVKSYQGDLNALLTVLINIMGHSSINGRIKQVNFLEHCAGFVGHCMAQHEWNMIVAQNLSRIIEAAIPINYAPASAVNLLPLRRLVKEFYDAGFIDTETVSSLEAKLEIKQTAIKQIGIARKFELSKEEILRRVEDDRERAKKYKEVTLSIIPGSDAEFDRLWSTEPSFGRQSKAMLKAENQLAGLPWH